MEWGGEDHAKRREHADCGRRYEIFVRRKSMVTTVGGGLRYLGKGSVGRPFPIQSGIVIVFDPVGSEKYRR